MLRADGACGRQTASMTDADVAAAIGEHVRAFNDRDIDALMSGFTDSVRSDNRVPAGDHFTALADADAFTRQACPEHLNRDFPA